MSLRLALVICGFGALSAAAHAQDIDKGRAEYQAQCAICHGLSGKGDGPYSTELKTRPADLTLIAKRNNGVFPVAQIYEVIDGRASTKAHGPRDMPIWGYRYAPSSLLSASPFSMSAKDATKEPVPYFDTAYDSEAVVRMRILTLIDYLNRIQEK